MQDLYEKNRAQAAIDQNDSEVSPFYYVFASDPQYPWTDKTDAGEQESDSDKARRSEKLIAEQYNNIARFREAMGGPQAVPLMINGDMTAFGHGWQREALYPLLKHQQLGDYNFGLGNHDYKNNVDDCFDNNCARDSLLDLISRRRKKVDDMDMTVSTSFPLNINTYSGSLAYAKIVGLFCLIQLNNEPTYQTEILAGHHLYPFTGIYNFEIHSALDWLEGWLEAATRSGLYIILNLHQPDQWQGSEEEITRFKKMINRYRVIAAFAGHYHTLAGRYDASAYFGDVPVFLSGSASQRTYLIAERNDDGSTLTVSLVSCLKNKFLI